MALTRLFFGSNSNRWDENLRNDATLDTQQTWSLAADTCGKIDRRNSQMLCTPRGSGGDLLTALLLYRYSIVELHAVNDSGDQFGPRNFNQRRSALLASMNTIERMLVRETQPRVFAVRSRTLAKVDSIGFVVRR